MSEKLKTALMDRRPKRCRVTMSHVMLIRM